MRLRVMGGALGVTLSACIGLLTLAPAAQASASVSFGTPQPVSGLQLLSIACASASTCYAVGNTATATSQSPTVQSAVVPITNGVPGPPVTVPLPSGAGAKATVTLGDIVCPSSSVCYAVGSYSDGSGLPGGEGGAVVTITNGTPSPPAIVPSTSAATPGTDNELSLNGISCWSASGCDAVGSLDTSSTGNDVYGISVPVTSGAPGSASIDPNAYEFDSIECSAASTCDIFGIDGNEDGLLVGLSGSSFAAPQSDSAVNGGATLACYSTASCLILPVFGGSYQTLTNNTTIGPVVNANIGFYGSCPTTAVCWTVGGTSSGQTVVEPIVSGVAQISATPNIGSLDGVACTSATTCLAIDTPLLTGTWGIVSMTGTVSASSSTPPPSTPPASGGTAATPELTAHAPTVKDGVVSVPVTCANAACRVGLSETISVKTGKRTRLEIVASRSVLIPEGHSALESLKLNSTGTRALEAARGGRLKTTLTISLDGKKLSARSLTLTPVTKKT